MLPRIKLALDPKHTCNISTTVRKKKTKEKRKEKGREEKKNKKIGVGAVA